MAFFNGSSYGPFNGKDAGPNRQPIPLLQQRPRLTRLQQRQKTLAAAGTDAAAPAAGKKYVINTDTTFAPFEFENDKGEMVGD